MFLTKNKKTLLIFLTFLTGLIILLPTFNYQVRLAQGDHGRDLYAFQMTAEGAIPYQDYPWFYGPLMPYYYAVIFLLFGESVRNVLIARLMLKFITGLIIFFIMRRIISPLWAYAAAIFFWGYYPFFFHTYNHIGGIFLSSLIALVLIRYIYTMKISNLYIGLVAIFFLSLVKINFGLCALFGFIISILVIDRAHDIRPRKRKIFYLSALVLLPTLIFAVYSFFVAGLSKHMIKQNFPYTKISQERSIEPILVFPEILDMLIQFLKEGPWNIVLAVLLIIALAGFIVRYKRLDSRERKFLPSVIFCFGLFSLAFLHEFILNGVYYNILWCLPFFIPLLFIILGKFLSTLPRNASLVCFTILFVIVAQKINADLTEILEYHKPQHYLVHERGRVILRNSPEWIDTVQTTVGFLEKTLREDELFFAFPYDPLYYFLLGRPSPTYHIVFFDFMYITAHQQRQIIEDLENKKVNWAIYSNRIETDEPNLGTFGETNSQLLSKYLNQNFELVGELGAWGRDPLWQKNHGIRIIRRKGYKKHPEN